MGPQPPRIFTRFFRWFCNARLQEVILGDLEEQFALDIKNYGLNRAKRRYAWTVLRFLRPEIIKSVIDTQKLNYYGMLKHNLLITIRGFSRHRMTFGLNLAGLVAGLTCVLFISLWVNDEMEKDHFHHESNKLFQVYSRHHNATETSVWRGVSGLLEKEIEAQIPQVKQAAVCTDVHEYTISIENNGVRANGRFADEEFLEILNYPLWKGDKQSLRDPSNIIITRSFAKRLFGKEDVMGQVLNWHFWGREVPVQVAGILEELPNTSSENFDFIMSWTYYHDELISFKGWGNYYGRVIVTLDDLSHKDMVEEKINDIFRENQSNDQVDLFLTNYADQYLYNNYENGEQAGGRIDYVYLIVTIAIFILLIACINFINLSTANASLKAKEIGVKKSFGASKRELASQFFMESVLLSTAATLLAMVLVRILLKPFNQLTDKTLTLSPDLPMLGFIVTFILIISIVSGLYPAIYLSGLKTLTVLKNKVFQGRGHSFGRKTLVVLQFSISIIMIVGTLITGQQMKYVQSKNLGYDRENVLYFDRDGKMLENHKTFINELENIPGVSMASATGFSLGLQNRTGGVSWEGKQEDEQVQFWENKGDHKSLDVLGLEIVEGRTFDDQFANEDQSIIFNETAIRTMGLKDPIGKTVHHYLGDKKIVGVVKDFTTESLHSPMEPALFLYQPERSHYIMAKIENGTALETIERMESLHKEFNPNYPFNPKFLDQDYQAQYESEMRISKLSGLFAGLAIFISCLGLFGLATFNVKRKTKEIGIKKVLGCNSWKLTISLTFGFTKAVFLALFISLPLSYLLGTKWLENFAYSITISWWMLTSAALVAIIIAWVTVGSQTLKAANANPVHTLRDE